MLVLTDKRARFANGEEILSFGRRCSCGGGRAGCRLSRDEIVQQMARNELRLHCVMCDEATELSAEEKVRIKKRL